MTQSKPDPIEFEGRFGKLYFYERVGFRAPRAGEYFLSGAPVSAYLARNDLTQRYAIVRPTFKARRVTRYDKGEPFDQNKESE